jgi:LysM repeat protein
LTIEHVNVFSTSKRLRRTGTALIALAALVSTAQIAFAQIDASPTEANPAVAAAVVPSLPDSPGFTRSTLDAASSSSIDDAADADDPASTPAPKPHHKIATHHDITVEPGETVHTLSAHEKVRLGLVQSFTLFSVVGWTTSAGYSHLVNGSPNYGTDSGAFGMRLGATALRNTSQNIMSNAVFAPIFHQDPRYYKMGSGHNFAKRAIYAATRAIITRSDDGALQPNYSLLSGNLAGAALTNTYYPTMNQGFTETAKTFGTSVGGSAVGFVVSEFLYDALDFAHLQKLE